MGQWKDLFAFTLGLISVCTGQDLAAASHYGKEPDSDWDGVSDYADFCPSTPQGFRVWTERDVQERRAAHGWEGCEGSVDVPVAGFIPPARQKPPAPGTKLADLDARFEWAARDAQVQFEDVRGWYTGRCYTAANANTPQGALLWSNTDSSAGPKYPPRRAFWIKTAPIAGYFDSMTPAQATEVEKQIKNEAEDFIDGTLSGDLSLCSTPDEVSTFVRKRRGGYFYAKTIKEGGCTGSKGSIVQECFFFKKVKN